MAETHRSLVFLLVFYALPLLVMVVAALALEGNLLLILLAAFWLGLGVILGGLGNDSAAA